MHINVFSLLFQLLDACVNNCGKPFLLAVASRDFENEYKKLIHKSHPRVSERLRQLLRSWAEGEFRNDSQLSLIPSLYAKLRQEGFDFPQPESSKVGKNVCSVDCIIKFFILCFLHAES